MMGRREHYHKRLAGQLGSWQGHGDVLDINDVTYASIDDDCSQLRLAVRWQFSALKH